MIPNSAFAVALKEPAAGPLAAAAFLSAVKGYTSGSARAFQLQQPGFLGRGLTLHAARALKAAAAAAGFDTVLSAEEDIPCPPPAVKALRIEPKAAGFTALGSGMATFVSFESVSLFTAAAYDAPVPPVSRAALEAGLLKKIRSLAGVPSFEPAAPAPPRETFFRSDVICGGGRLHLLLEPETLDFSPLGPERSLSSLENFRQLLHRASGPCFHAVKNHFLAAFLAGLPLAPLKLASPQACEVELSRLLLITPNRAS